MRQVLSSPSVCRWACKQGLSWKPGIGVPLTMRGGGALCCASLGETLSHVGSHQHDLVKSTLLTRIHIFFRGWPAPGSLGSPAQSSWKFNGSQRVAQGWEGQPPFPGPSPDLHPKTRHSGGVGGGQCSVIRSLPRDSGTHSSLRSAP